jgi:hypothetical protein
LTFQSSNAQSQSTHSEIDSTLIAAVITITKDGNTIIKPQFTTIKQNEEILILNNDTVTHSFTNGANPQDQCQENYLILEQFNQKDSQNIWQSIYHLAIILFIQKLIQL